MKRIKRYWKYELSFFIIGIINTLIVIKISWQSYNYNYFGSIADWVSELATAGAFFGAFFK